MFADNAVALILSILCNFKLNCFSSANSTVQKTTCIAPPAEIGCFKHANVHVSHCTNTTPHGLPTALQRCTKPSGSHHSSSYVGNRQWPREASTARPLIGRLRVGRTTFRPVADFTVEELKFLVQACTVHVGGLKRAFAVA